MNAILLFLVLATSIGVRAHHRQSVPSRVVLAALSALMLVALYSQRVV